MVLKVLVNGVVLVVIDGLLLVNIVLVKLLLVLLLLDVKFYIVLVGEIKLIFRFELKVCVRLIFIEINVVLILMILFFVIVVVEVVGLLV